MQSTVQYHKLSVKIYKPNICNTFTFVASRLCRKDLGQYMEIWIAERVEYEGKAFAEQLGFNYLLRNLYNLAS
jgi:hypothetical protein